MDGTEGIVALVGGSEWTDGCSFDADLLAASKGDEVLVLPTAAAYEGPERSVMAAADWFASLGAKVEGLMVLSRSDAEHEAIAKRVRKARFIYLSDGSPLHLRSVLKNSKVMAGLRHAWEAGAVIAGSGAGGMVLTDPMVDPRGGALTVGLGMVEKLAIVTHYGNTHEDQHGAKLHRSVGLAADGLPVVGIPERTALIRRGKGVYEVAGAGSVTVFMNGGLAAEGLGALTS